MADVRVIVVGGSGALIDSAYLPAEEAVLGRQEQDPCGWIPSGLGQQLLVQRSRQHRGGAVETDTGEHMRELGRLLAAHLLRRGPRRRSPVHRAEFAGTGHGVDGRAQP